VLRWGLGMWDDVKEEGKEMDWTGLSWAGVVGAQMETCMSETG
jgi:hypothetical protein